MTEGALAVELYPAAKRFGMGGGKRDAGIDGGFVVRGGLDVNKLLDEVEQGRLLAAGSGQQGAHGNGG